MFCVLICVVLVMLLVGICLVVELGRFIVVLVMIVVLSVMGKVMCDGCWWYYLDDGVYGLYSGCIFDYNYYFIDSLDFFGECSLSVLVGLICDSVDVIEDDIMLFELDCGVLIVGCMMGVYMFVMVIDFNFFKKVEIVVINEYIVEECDVVLLIVWLKMCKLVNWWKVFIDC